MHRRLCMVQCRSCTLCNKWLDKSPSATQTPMIHNQRHNTIQPRHRNLIPIAESPSEGTHVLHCISKTDERVHSGCPVVRGHGSARRRQSRCHYALWHDAGDRRTCGSPPPWTAATLLLNSAVPSACLPVCGCKRLCPSLVSNLHSGLSLATHGYSWLLTASRLLYRSILGFSI